MGVKLVLFLAVVSLSCDAFGFTQHQSWDGFKSLEKCMLRRRRMTFSFAQTEQTNENKDDGSFSEMPKTPRVDFPIIENSGKHFIDGVIAPDLKPCEEIVKNKSMFASSSPLSAVGNCPEPESLAQSVPHSLKTAASSLEVKSNAVSSDREANEKRRFDELEAEMKARSRMRAATVTPMDRNRMRGSQQDQDERKVRIWRGAELRNPHEWVFIYRNSLL
jgi:hypothetical protein